MLVDVLGRGGLFEKALPGYESRPGQLAMAKRIAEAITYDERLCVEAGTGTGKTLAYLVPAILSGRRVVVSTATKTLQDQIARVDLPRLASLLPVPFTFAVMKGLGNYVCRRRLEIASRQAELIQDPSLARVLAFAETAQTGDRAELVELAEDHPIWGRVTASPETRLGGRCPFFESCFVTQMRRRAAGAQVIVTNHHLFFADLALRTTWPDAQVLPPYEIAIFDEAHQIEDTATEFFGVHVSSARLHALGRDLGQAPFAFASRAGHLGRRLEVACDELALALRGALGRPRGQEAEQRAPFGPELFAPKSRVEKAYHDVDGALEEVSATFGPDRMAVGHEPGGRQRPGEAEMEGLARRAEVLRQDLGVLADTRARGQDFVRWVGAGPRHVSLHASPIDVGPTLSRAFAQHPGPLVFASATLTVAGKFDFVRERLGLGDSASEATFPSPFRYHEQALFYIAPDLPEPNAERFAQEAAVRCAELCEITDGRALLLFTSFKNLHVAAAHLRAHTKFPLLVQGERPRSALLEALRTRLGSVLLATQSFWEGVDVPGEALSLVVMDRLPFEVPDDPLLAARIARVREAGGDPFASLQVPRAALALKQGFGRLVRTRRDVGVVALLDGRIARRSYGGALLGSLPVDCPRTDSLEEVAVFWRRAKPPAA